MKSILLSAAVAMIAAMPAFAGSSTAPDIHAVTPAPAPVDVDRWAGPYVGGYIGSAYEGSEMMFGLQAGYNWQRGSFVFGGELDAFTADTTGDYEVFVNARAGVAIGSNALVFVKAGRGQYLGTLGLNALGLGAEYAVSDSISIRFDYELHNTVSDDVFDGPGFAKIGVNWGF